jgi:hypothetical protein
MKRIVTSLVLIFLLFSSTSVVYAQIQDKPDNVLDSISEFYIVDEQLVSPEGSTLVPIGAIRSVNDVYYIEYEYEVIVKQGMDLSVMIDDLVFTNDLVNEQELRNTFQFEIEEEVVDTVGYHDHFLSEETDANVVKVRVIVSMVEPESYELFTKLVNGSLNFEVYFFVV